MARVGIAIEGYNVCDTARIFKIEESGISFKSSCRHCPGKGDGRIRKELYTTKLSTSGGLERVTVMVAVSASERAYKPVIVYPGKEALYRYVGGQA